MTKTERQRLALALLKARPPVMPGTNAIVDDTARRVWYACCTEIADVCCRGEGADKDRINADLFFTIAGVPD